MLSKLAKKYGTDKGAKKHRYTDIYERWLSPYRKKEFFMIEIGIDKGASLKMWLDYFPQAFISGVDPFLDNNKDYKDDIIKIDESRLKCFEGYQSDLEILEQMSVNSPFIVIDDGSHRSSDQCVSLAYLFKNMKRGGLYFIEDLNCRRTIGNSPTMIFILKYFIKTGKIDRAFINDIDAEYLESNIDFCKIYNNKICVIKKKNKE